MQKYYPQLFMYHSQWVNPIGMTRQSISTLSNQYFNARRSVGVPKECKFLLFGNFTFLLQQRIPPLFQLMTRLDNLHPSGNLSWFTNMQKRVSLSGTPVNTNLIYTIACWSNIPFFFSIVLVTVHYQEQHSAVDLEQTGSSLMGNSHRIHSGMNWSIAWTTSSLAVIGTAHNFKHNPHAWTKIFPLFYFLLDKIRTISIGTITA